MFPTNVRSSWLMVLFSSTMSMLIFCLLDLSITGGVGVSNFNSGLTISPCSSTILYMRNLQQREDKLAHDSVTASLDFNVGKGELICWPNDTHLHAQEWIKLWFTSVGVEWCPSQNMCTLNLKVWLDYTFAYVIKVRIPRCDHLKLGWAISPMTLVLRR